MAVAVVVIAVDATVVVGGAAVVVVVEAEVTNVAVAGAAKLWQTLKKMTL